MFLKQRVEMASKYLTVYWSWYHLISKKAINIINIEFVTAAAKHRVILVLKS